MFKVGQLVKIKSAAEIMGYPKVVGGWVVGDVFFSRSMLSFCNGYAIVNDIYAGNHFTLTNFIGTPSISVIGRKFWSEEMLEPAFKVGTRVRIKDWKNVVRDAPEFVSSMRPLCGRYATIARMEGSRIWLDNWSNTSGDLIWLYNIDMVEPIMPITVSVDFDGTITQAVHPTKEGFNKLRSECKEVMDYLSRNGVSFYLHSARTLYMQEAVGLCMKWKLPICIKDPNTKKLTDWYIEDRSVGVSRVDWKEIKTFFQKELKNRKGENI